MLNSLVSSFMGPPQKPTAKQVYFSFLYRYHIHSKIMFGCLNGIDNDNKVSTFRLRVGDDESATQLCMKIPYCSGILFFQYPNSLRCSRVRQLRSLKEISKTTQRSKTPKQQSKCKIDRYHSPNFECGISWEYSHPFHFYPILSQRGAFLSLFALSQVEWQLRTGYDSENQGTTSLEWGTA